MKIKKRASDLYKLTEQDFEKEYKNLLTKDEYDYSLDRFIEARDYIFSFLYSLEGTMAEFSEETLNELFDDNDRIR